MSDFDLTGAVLEDRYEVTERIAEGAMGSVWRGERVKLGRQVAIKIMHEQLPDELASRQRFEREAKLMARLDHPNCVSVIDFGIHNAMPFLVMELVRGTSLQQVMDRDGKLEPARAVELIKQVLSGLAHAHELGIVHRDIKPSNLMVGEKTGIGVHVRILDFGLARLTDTNIKLTTGIVVGTPNYMAPEQCRGGQLDGRCDLYACGVILFELLTGRKPFVSDDPYQVVRKHIHETPPRLAEVSPGDYGALEEVVARALAKTPEQRFATAQEMALAMDAAMAPRRGFAHAVPHMMRSVPTTPQFATESGWAVPDQASGLRPQASGADTVVDAPPTVVSPPPVPPPATARPAPPPSDPPSVVGSRQSALRSLLSRLPFPPTRRNLAIVGGSVAAVLLFMIVLITHHRGSSSQPAASPAAHDNGASANDPSAATIQDINDLIVSGDKEEALDHALRARKQYPDSAELAVLTGRIYFSKLYWTDGIKNFRDAIRLQPSYRSDPEVIKTALRGFITTPDVDDRLEEFLLQDIGEDARPYLEETARDHPNSIIRARAADELRRLR